MDVLGPYMIHIARVLLFGQSWNCDEHTLLHSTHLNQQMAPPTPLAPEHMPGLLAH